MPQPRNIVLCGLFVLLVGLSHGVAAAVRPVIPLKPQMRSEKESRTPAQQKINSQLLYEIYRLRVDSKRQQVPLDPTGVRTDGKKRALVDVRAEVTPALQKKVRALGGTIESTSATYRSIIAWIPLRRLERLAADPAVRAIEPAAEATVK